MRWCPNHFLSVQEFPERQEDVERGCSALMEKYRTCFEKWFAVFMPYCSRNLFTVPRHVPVYDLDHKEDSKALEEAEELCGKIMALEYFNAGLHKRLAAMDQELEGRRKLMREIAEVERRTAVVERARELERQLRALVEDGACDKVEQ